MAIRWDPLRDLLPIQAEDVDITVGAEQAKPKKIEVRAPG